MRAQIKLVPIVDTIPADLLTPLLVYLALSEGEGNAFLLESVAGGETLARYSFIGANPEAVISGNSGLTSVVDRNGSSQLNIPLFDHIREHFSYRSTVPDPELPLFIGGAIGYMGFDCSEWFVPSFGGGKERSQSEDVASFMIFTTIVAFDHATQVIKLISLALDEGTDKDGSEASVRAANERNAAIRFKLESKITIPPRATSGTRGTEIRSNWPQPEFEAAVIKVKELIAAGECYQVVLSQCFRKLTDVSAISLYRALRSLNPSPYMFLLKFGERSVVGGSPEMLVRCQGDRLEYRPIAGTRPRGVDAANDARLGDEMRADKKEVAEHMMLVDLGRNDLGRVAEFGSVKVETLMRVEKYSHVQHLVSSLSAKLKKGDDRFDALASCFPAGTVSGAPKVRAMKIIRELEPSPRGIYAGAVGYISYSGNMDTCIAIRTLVLENGEVTIQAGAGIVADSIPSAEFAETVNKAKVLLRAVEMAENGEF
jgi:anthranilate synthase component I